jgi:hypothetical protein
MCRPTIRLMDQQFDLQPPDAKDEGQIQLNHSGETL